MLLWHRYLLYLSQLEPLCHQVLSLGQARLAPEGVWARSDVTFCMASWSQSYWMTGSFGYGQFCLEAEVVRICRSYTSSFEQQIRTLMTFLAPNLQERFSVCSG